MRRFVFLLAAVGLVSLVYLASSTLRQLGGPRAGDVVRPHLQQSLHWTAGTTVQLPVQLVAQAPGAATGRPLPFFGDADPVAVVTFYDGERQLAPVTLTLSHRC